MGPGATRLAASAESHGWPWIRQQQHPTGQPLIIAASGALERFHDGWYWNAVDRAVPISNASAASGDGLAASCASAGNGWEVSTDVLGVQPLFYAQVERTLWFSTSAARLIRSVASAEGIDLVAAGPDPTGWRSIILLGFPPPGLSAFAGVRTMLPGECLSIDTAGSLRSRCRLPEERTTARATIDDLIDALRSALPSERTHIDLPLSGGWDSRLLAGLLARRSTERVEAWTTTTDDGIELDLALAPPVARHLGLRHHEFVDHESSWPDLAVGVLRRTDYQSWMHAWLLPLANELRRRRHTVVDGFGGDFVLRRLFQTVERDNISNTDSRHAIWTEMGASRAASEVAWSREGRDWLADPSGFEAFERSVAAFDGHANWQALTVVATRAARCIGLAPFRLVAPGTPLSVPFLSAAARDVLYAGPIYRRRGPDLYRAILHRLDSELGALPTTNDADVERVRGAYRRETAPASLRQMAEQIAANDDAMRLLSRRLRSAVAESDIEALAKSTSYVVPLRALQAVYGLTQWQLDHPSAQSGIWST